MARPPRRAESNHANFIDNTAACRKERAMRKYSFPDQLAFPGCWTVTPETFLFVMLLTERRAIPPTKVCSETSPKCPRSGLAWRRQPSSMTAGFG